MHFAWGGKGRYQNPCRKIWIKAGLLLYKKGEESAPGQITLDEMQNLYHASLINRETNVIGIIGEFAENSMSKYMHNPNF